MKVDQALLDDMRVALLAEFGACAIYRVLSRTLRDAELATLLAEYAREEEAQLVRVRALLHSLGAQPPLRSRRRQVLAWCLAQSTRCGGRALTLRLCYESEQQLARWYAGHGAYLRRVGLLHEALCAEELSLVKQRHAGGLAAWVRR
ncbi:MAG: hypothetical protein RIT40_899 [Planctomycetota bacterium]|jgi:demethoxyubiquinone hydroxylase (CLK1/Coq7/Cat5 family)